MGSHKSFATGSSSDSYVIENRMLILESNLILDLVVMCYGLFQTRFGVPSEC